MTTPPYLVEELAKARAMLAKNPDIQRIEMMIPDINGVLRGKWLPVSSLESIYTQGVRLAGSLFALDLWGAEIFESGMVTETGDPDAICFPVEDGLQICDWMEAPIAQLLVNMFDMDGQPFFADPSQILASITDKLLKHGLRPVVALEMEFHLLDKDKDMHEELETSHSHVYSLQELERYRDLFTEIEDACKTQGIPSDTIITEAGVNQFEINLHHVVNAQLACEHAILLKRIIKSIADKHGVIASFMAKPFADDAGNGMHTNISFIDENDQNVFCDESPYGSPIMQAALAGLLDTMIESTLLFAPHANSYRRFQPDAHAPTAVCWGIDNRNVAIRLPINAGSSMRIEHRVAGADANPFLVLSAILAGMIHGIENKPNVPPPETSVPDPETSDVVPHHWDEAIELFRQSTILRKYLGEKFCDLYICCKEQEIRTIHSKVSDIEYDRYLVQS